LTSYHRQDAEYGTKHKGHCEVPVTLGFHICKTHSATILALLKVGKKARIADTSITNLQQLFYSLSPATFSSSIHSEDHTVNLTTQKDTTSREAAS
jgi:hypothetical protein